MRNFLSRLNIQNSLVVGLLVAGFVMLLAFGAVSFIAHLFNTTLVTATGWAVAGVTYAVLLGVGLGAEAWVKSADREPPSWLPKANRIMIGGSLIMGASIVGWQFLWGWGASGLHSQGFWMVGSTILVMGLVLAFGLGAMALGQKLGAEFLPGMALAMVVALNGLVALDVNTRGSYTDQAAAGELYYVFRTPSGGPKPATATTPAVLVPSPVTAWELSVLKKPVLRIGNITLWSEEVYRDRRSNKPAYQLQYWDLNQSAWVDQWNQQAQADVAVLESYTGTFVLGGLGVIIMGVLFAGWWRGKWSFSTLIACGVGLCLILGCMGCGGMFVSDLLGLNIDDHVEDISRRVSGAPAKFYQPFQIEPQGSVRIGSPPGSGSVYICQCGSTHRQLWLEANWHTDAQYHAGQYAMAPQGCGGQWNVSDGNVYRVHNRAGDLSPVMKVMTFGETWVCPDGTSLTAR